MGDVKEKRCPFLVHREKTSFKYSCAEVTTEQFNPCIGEKCAAYCRGTCIRLPLPFLVADREMTDEEFRELADYIRDSPPTPTTVLDQKWGGIPW